MSKAGLIDFIVICVFVYICAFAINSLYMSSSVPDNEIDELKVILAKAPGCTHAKGLLTAATKNDTFARSAYIKIQAEIYRCIK